jgi:hypothetical protein
MRASLSVLFVLSIAVVAFAADNKRASTFKNFEYPFAIAKGWPHQLEWQNLNERNKVTLVDGRWSEPADDPNEPFSGLILESVKFGDVTGDGQSSAIVVLRYDTGGTQYSHYVYIFSLRGNRTKLLAYFHSGDRASFGLYRVYPANGNLVVELFDPRRRQGDCCSNGFVRKRFHWTKSLFRQVGKTEYGTPNAESRLEVDTFGKHR